MFQVDESRANYDSSPKQYPNLSNSVSLHQQHEQNTVHQIPFHDEATLSKDIASKNQNHHPQHIFYKSHSCYTPQDT